MGYLRRQNVIKGGILHCTGELKKRGNMMLTNSLTINKSQNNDQEAYENISDVIVDALYDIEDKGRRVEEYSNQMPL